MWFATPDAAQVLWMFRHRENGLSGRQLVHTKQDFEREVQ